MMQVESESAPALNACAPQQRNVRDLGEVHLEDRRVSFMDAPLAANNPKGIAASSPRLAPRLPWVKMTNQEHPGPCFWRQTQLAQPGGESERDGGISQSLLNSASIFFRTFSSIQMSGGQGLLKPSPESFFV